MSETDQKLLNCYSDLNRAAVSLYLAPEGKTYMNFLAHALKILKDMKNEKARGFETEIENMRNYGNDPRKVADKLLTIGLLLKPRIVPDA